MPKAVVRTYVSREEFGPVQAKVKWFSPRSGIGFFERPGEPDIIFFRTHLNRCGMGGISDAQSVSVTYEENRKKPGHFIAVSFTLA